MTRAADGFFGLAPYTAVYVDPRTGKESVYPNEYNFMYHLRASEKIQHNVFSIYTNLAPAKSHIKFGGYDESGMENAAEMVLLKTANSTTWSINLAGVSFHDLSLQIPSKNTVASFNPAYPYIYLPEGDFNSISTQINALLSKVQKTVCSTWWGECRILKSCQEVK